MAKRPYSPGMVEAADRQELIWVGSSLEDMKDLPEDVRKVFGHALDEAQRGEYPFIAAPMKGLAGVHELREDFNSDTFRTIYIAKLKKGIYILHVFQKKSKKGKQTPKQDMDTIRRRLKEALEEDAS